MGGPGNFFGYGWTEEQLKSHKQRNCNHEWVDTGSKLTWCKKCDVDGEYTKDRKIKPIYDKKRD